VAANNFVHKRTAKGVKSLQRQRASKQPYHKVLVVCEGEKTEPYYFSELRDQYRLNSATVEVVGCRLDPYRIFTVAKRRYRDEKERGDPFDKVYCVFDKDNHTSYHNALHAIQNAKPKDTFEAIPFPASSTGYYCIMSIRPNPIPRCQENQHVSKWKTI